jgi:hypothetical protein
MNKYFVLLIYLPHLFSQDYLMQLPMEMQLNIYQWVVYDNDFTKAFSNFKNLKRINKKFKALAENPVIKSCLLSSAFHGDLNTNLANISHLAAHKSLNCIDGNDEHSQTLIKQNLMPQVARLFSHFPQPFLRDPKSSLFVTPDDATKLFAFISSSIIGTNTIINTLAEQLKSDFKPVHHFNLLIFYTREKKWHANVQVYLRVFESIKRISQNKKNATVLSLCQVLLGKAAEYRDRLSIPY